MTPQQIDEMTGSKGKLISAAIELMASHGYENTSVQDILDLAEVTKSNFYYHFKSKEELCLAALEVMQEQAFNYIFVPTLLNKELSPKNRFQALFDMLLAKMENDCCQQGCPFTNLASETSDFYPPFRESLTRFYQRQTKIIEQCLKEGIEQGEFRKSLPPEETANMMIATMNGVMVLAKAYKSTDVIKQTIGLLFQLISEE